MRLHVVRALHPPTSCCPPAHPQLGIGSVGTLIAHHLRLANPTTPISLIVKRAQHVPRSRHPRRRDAPPITLSVERAAQRRVARGFDLEVWARGGETGSGGGRRSEDDRYLDPEETSDERDRLRARAELDEEEQNPHSLQPEPPLERRYTLGPDPRPDGPIQSLIVCLKAPTTFPALQALAPRLTPRSVITLLQNGMGVYDQLCRTLFPDPSTRPFFILGTTTHGVAPTEKGQMGEVRHNSRPGEGQVQFGVAPDPQGEVDMDEWLWGFPASQTPILVPPASPRRPLPLPPPAAQPRLANLTETLTALLSLSHLSPALLPMPHLHHQLLLKVALNATINPLTAILGGGALPNGCLVSSDPTYRLVHLLTTETSAVLTAYLQNLSSPIPPPPDVLRLFSPDALERRVFALCRATSANISSMAVDVRHGQQTEIDHINGYIIGLGKRLGVDTPNHRLVVELVKSVTSMSGLDKRVPRELKQGLAQRRSVLRSGADKEMQERGLLLEERKLEVEERRLRLMEERLAEKVAHEKHLRKQFYADLRAKEKIAEAEVGIAEAIREQRVGASSEEALRESEGAVSDEPDAQDAVERSWGSLGAFKEGFEAQNIANESAASLRQQHRA